MSNDRANPLLEICIASAADAQAAASAEADRLELNSALVLGGLTPSLGVLQEIKATTSLPVFVLIRPRTGDFVYDASEQAVMARDIELALAYGADGVVFGVLDGNGQIDGRACRFLRGVAGDRPAVFHRAFDFCADPFCALEELIDLGFQRVLTSGQCSSALEGADRIAQLNRQAAGRIEVLPGGGIKPDNVLAVLRKTGCDQVHASLRRLRTPATRRTAAVRLNAPTLPPDDCHEETDPAAVQAMKAALIARNSGR